MENGTTQAEPTSIASVVKASVMVAKGDGRGSEIANRTPWLALSAPFDNLEMRVWLDYPKEVATLWTAVEGESVEDVQARVLDACKRTFLEHRGADGQPWKLAGETLPSCDTDEFWALIPNSLLAEMIRRWQEEMTDSPTSRASRRARRRS